MELHIIGHSGHSSIGVEQISDFRYDEMGVFLDRGCKSNGALKLRRVSCVSGRSQKISWAPDGRAGEVWWSSPLADTGDRPCPPTPILPRSRSAPTRSSSPLS